MVAAVQALINQGAVRAEAIGVITPYAAQREAIRRRLAAERVLRKVEVNTVDAFQGREKDVIVLSTVRPAGRGGAKGKGGKGSDFVADPRRACVALTRAR